jgi:DNA polymerase III delta subunit
MEACEYDYGRCLLEIDKIKNHAKATKAEDMLNNVFELLLFDGTIYQPPKDAIFDFVDAILDVQLNETFKLYQQCLEVKEAVMVMISVLYNNARAVLQVQSCESNDISKSTGLTGWQIQNAKKHLHKRSTGELINILKICQECQQGIVTGTIEEEFVMDYILVNLF